MKRRRLGPLGVSAALLMVASSPSVAGTDKPILAVFNLEDRGVGLSAKLLLRLSDYLAMQLAATGAYELVPRDQLKERLTKQKQSSYKACYAQSCQIDIGKELAAQKSLATSVMKLGSRCMVTAIMYDLRKSTSEGGASAEGSCTEDGIVESIKTLATKLVPQSKVISPKATQPKNRGGILIKTTPKGASVKIDGVPVEGVTPLTVTDLAAGEHLLEMSKGDFGYTGKVMVRADDYVTLSLPLKRAEVQLEVISNPPEAAILLNGMEMGRTPKIFSAVKVGEHVIELRKAGFLPERQAIRLGAGTRRQSVRVQLRLAAAEKQRPATLKVDRRPRAEGDLRRRDAVEAHELRYGPQIRERRRKTIWGYTTLGVGAALVGSAAVLFGVGASQGQDAHTAYRAATENAPPTDLVALDQHRSDIESARAKIVAGGAIAGLGVAAVGFAIYKLVTRPDVPEAPSNQANRVQVGFVASRMTGSVLVTGAFR